MSVNSKIRFSKLFQEKENVWRKTHYNPNTRIYEPSELSINPHGAVSVITPKGLLGVKPDEFEWVEP